MLILADEHRRSIETHGAGGYPEEICGFLVGRAVGDTKTVEQVVPIENAWEDDASAGAAEFAGKDPAFTGATRRRRFWIPPDEYYRADRTARAADRSILGFYHSHPDHPARPSVYDLNLAREIFPGYSYVIVAIHERAAVDMTSWVLRDDGSAFDAEEMASCA